MHIHIYYICIHLYILCPQRQIRTNSNKPIFEQESQHNLSILMLFEMNSLIDILIKNVFLFYQLFVRLKSVSSWQRGCIRNLLN